MRKVKAFLQRLGGAWKLLTATLIGILSLAANAWLVLTVKNWSGQHWYNPTLVFYQGGLGFMKGLAAAVLGVVGNYFLLRAAAAFVGTVRYGAEFGVGPALFAFSWQLGVALFCLFGAWLLWSAWREDRLVGGGRGFSIVLVVGLVGLGVFVFGDSALNILRSEQAKIDAAEKRCLDDHQRRYGGLGLGYRSWEAALKSDLPSCVEYQRIHSERVRELQRGQRERWREQRERDR